ncbi:hypothetical protein L614_000800001930 [Ochrobactrum sp. J50]|uniref:hypothetical protein n=1 Tax=Brucella/Ochrobactrum group TaxID=2826938 RepID=UPI00119C9F12|nr:hypothetical protein [Ochrobactrum sp. J50]TWG95817.1 hypothetical protein L614_000800001930 [Ochrobactrum sp. J50]WPM81270.1 hypothetical protein R5W60_06185 [Brucella pseudintermedia]
MIPALKTTVASICLGGLVTVLAPLVAPASAAQLQRCASENGICQLPYPAEVVYGTGGRNTSRFIDRPQVNCSNRVFGDPAPGQKKSCSFVVQDRWDRPDRPGRPDRRDRPGRYDPYHRYEDRDRDRDRDWSRCAKEGGFCDFYGRKRVRYGAEGRFTEGVFRNGVRCDNRTFGDPARGKSKTCYVLD